MRKSSIPIDEKELNGKFEIQLDKKKWERILTDVPFHKPSVLSRRPAARSYIPGIESLSFPLDADPHAHTAADGK